MATNPRKLVPGAVVGGYRVLNRLGRGATATVYLAETLESGTQVALKAMHADLLATGSHAASRMKREIELVHRIDHPGVCRIYDLHADDRLLFLTMQYIAGQPLDAALQAAGRLQVPRAARILRAICRALAAAHAVDILHRDLKPSNIMLTQQDVPIILDFGYATGPDVGRLTATGQWVGTLYYAAPELLKNEPNTKLSDIYSMGVIAYQCLTGHLPFQGTHAGEIAEALLFRDPKPPRSLCFDIPASLEAIIMKAMHRTPALRFANIMELEGALAPFEEAAPSVRAPFFPTPAMTPADAPTDSNLTPPLTPHVRSDSASGPTQVQLKAPVAQESGEEVADVLDAEAAPAAPSVPAAPAPMAHPAAPKQPVPVRAVHTPTPLAPPVTTSRPTPPDPVELRHLYEARAKSLQEAKHARGLLKGDHLTLESVERMALLEFGRGRLKEAVGFIDLALEEIARIHLDAAFISHKIQRLDKAMRTGRNAQALPKLEPFLNGVMQAFERQDFDAANLALNQAFAALTQLA